MTDKLPEGLTSMEIVEARMRDPEHRAAVEAIVAEMEREQVEAPVRMLRPWRELLNERAKETNEEGQR